MPKPTLERLRKLVARLREPIHHRPRPKPKPRATWRGLKVGDKLTKGPTHWVVESCDSGGVTLRVCHPFRGNTTLYVTDERDLGDFARVAKPRARKRKEAKL